MTIEVDIEEFGKQEIRDFIGQAESCYGGQLEVLDDVDGGYTVVIYTEDGDDEECSATITDEQLREEIARVAIRMGYIDEHQSSDRVMVVDFGQFDVWDAGFTVQLAAFGNEVIS